ncbi:hypothetical protein PP707_05825 [Acetobacter pasteurianus]|nr:hypothetical protein [Acetobacter pasteurianus]
MKFFFFGGGGPYWIRGLKEISHLKLGPSMSYMIHKLSYLPCLSKFDKVRGAADLRKV